MRLISLQVENIGRITAAAFDFDEQGNLVMLKGKNRAGKSTILDSVIYLLAGKTAIPENAVQDGKNKGKVAAQIDDYYIERVIKQDRTSQLKITNKGMLVPSPQKFLDQVSSKFLDPTDLVNLSGKEVRKNVLQYLGVNTDDLDEQIKELEIQRRECGRRGKEIGEPVEVKPVDPVDTAELYAKLDEVREFNQEQEQIRHKTEQLQQRIRELEIELGEVTEELTELPNPKELKPENDIREKINNASEINKQARDYEKYLEQKERLEKERTEYQGYTEQIEKARKEKTQRLMEATKDLEGIEITDETVVVDGHVWERLSTSESLEIATQLCMRITPKDGIQAIFIKRGESILTEARERIAQMAEKNGFQIILEVATDQDPSFEPGTFFIEEGEIVQDKQDELF